MQKQPLKILVTLALFIHISFLAASQPLQQLAAADSLFASKQYTQSLEIYQQLLESGAYSPASLLRMSLIEEGLGHIDKSLYYLDLAYQATHLDAVLAKMEEVAAKSGLSGYEVAPFDQMRGKLAVYQFHLTMGLCALAFFLLAVIYWLRTKRNHKPVGVFVLLIFTLAALLVLANFPLAPKRGILTNQPIYLMSGPSSGADVVAILTPGHRMIVEGTTDVWAKVRWKEKFAYVKQSQLLPVEL